MSNNVVEDELIQVLNKSEQLFSDELNLSNEEKLELYYLMLKARLFDERMIMLQRQGRVGTYGSFSGQEAAQIGSAYVLSSNDWIFPSYRDLAAIMAHGLSPEQLLLYFRGDPKGGHIPDNLRIFPIQIIISSQLLHATGCSLASKLRGEEDVSVAYFGDGATSQGDFHEALNFAAVYNTPTVFFCQNNHWAISTPFEQQTKTNTISEKADAYGIQGYRVDGNDVLAVVAVMKQAVKSAREQKGPVLIEAVTYRYENHTTADDATKYRDEQTVAQWKQEKDPINRYREHLVGLNILNDKLEEEYKAKINNEINAAVDEVENYAGTSLQETFAHVYANTPDDLIE